jgi:hypothetical protein
MFKSILLATTLALPILPFSAPVQAETELPFPKSITSGLIADSQTSVPLISVYVKPITNNVTCRNKARAKYFELGATNMNDPNDNAQWATINSMKALTWCRGTEVFIAVATNGSYSSAEELRDILQNAQ